MDLNNYKKELELLDDMHQSYSLLFIALNKIQTDADAHLKDITLRQLMILIAISHLEEEDSTIVNIASAIGTSKQNVTRLVNAMIKSGYVVSNPSEVDKRSVNISITERGLNVMNQNTIISNQYFFDIFKDFSSTEIKTLHKMLNKLADYDHKNENHFEKQAEINIGKETKEMEDFLKQIKNHFFQGI